MAEETKQLVAQAIEMLMCAEINCDNGKTLGLVMFDAVKMQIRDAIDKLEALTNV